MFTRFKTEQSKDLLPVHYVQHRYRRGCATALAVSKLPGSILGFVVGKAALALLFSPSISLQTSPTPTFIHLPSTLQNLSNWQRRS